MSGEADLLNLTIGELLGGGGLLTLTTVLGVNHLRNNGKAVTEDVGCDATQMGSDIGGKLDQMIAAQNHTNETLAEIKGVLSKR